MAAPFERPTLTVALRRVRVLADVRDRLGDDVVGRRLDRRREPLLGQLGDLDRDRRPRQQRVERRAEAALGEDGRVDAARELAQLREPVGEIVLGRRRGSPARPRGSLSSFAATMLSSSATETSRCCAPSCRLRSSRRRSASPTSTSRARDAASFS